MAGVLRAVGRALKETGLALDRAGATLQASYAFREERECAAGLTREGTPREHAPPPPRAACAVSRHRTLAPLLGKAPSLGRDVFVAPSAAVIGDVRLGDNASVFYGSVIRGMRPRRWASCMSALPKAHWRAATPTSGVPPPPPHPTPPTLPTHTPTHTCSGQRQHHDRRQEQCAGRVRHPHRQRLPGGPLRRHHHRPDVHNWAPGFAARLRRGRPCPGRHECHAAGGLHGALQGDVARCTRAYRARPPWQPNPFAPARAAH